MTSEFDSKPWRIQVQPFINELLSSFLIRTANAHGLVATRFCYYHFPDDNVWNRDIDQSASPQFIERVSVKAHLSISDVTALTLTDTPIFALNRLGIYHRTRNRYGLRFCPLCIADSPYYRREWRSVWAVFCSHHQCHLLDSCATCGTMITPHRAAQTNRCHLCGSSLAFQQAIKVDESLNQLIKFQNDCINSLEHNELNSANPCRISNLAGLDLLYRLRKIKEKAKHVSTELLPECVHASLAEPTPSLSRIAGAIFHLESTRYLTNNWPTSFRKIATSLCLRSHSLGKLNTQTSSQLVDEIKRLPERDAREASPIKPSSSFRNQIRQIHRKKCSDWRLHRAMLLLKAAKVRHVD